MMAPVRKTTAQKAEIKSERRERLKAYTSKYEELISQGKETLEADLIANIYVAWQTCGCETCRHMSWCPLQLNHFVPAHVRASLLEQYYLDQYVLCSNCEVVVEVQRYEQLKRA
jgi:hypothetical protein